MKKLLPGPARGAVDSATQSQALMELRQGEIFELKGQWKQAEDHYTQSTNAGGGAPALRKLASIQLQRREYDAARKTITTLREANGDNDDTMLLQGLLELRQGNVNGGESIFLKKPDAPQSLYGLALVAINRGDSTKAKEFLTKAAAGANPAVSQSAQIIAQAYNEFALFPDGQPIHLATLLARSLAQVNECETALILLKPVVLEAPQYRDAWVVKGYCEFTSERLNDALASLEQAYAIDPQKPEIQYFLARTHAALGDPQNAVTFLQYAIINGFKPEADARELLAEYAQELGNTVLALEQYKILADSQESDLSDFTRYVMLAISTKDHELDGLASAKDALTRWPDDAGALTLAARAAFAAGLTKDATNYIEKALTVDPKNPEARAVQEEIKKGVVTGAASSK
jgi:Tfp pilus assembly protein PilF